MTSIVAFTAEQVCKLTGLSLRQLRYWDATQFFKPRPTGNRLGAPFGKIYSFRDVVGLRAIAILRNEHHLPLQQLRTAGRYLHRRSDTPWASLRLFVVGGGRKKRVAFEDPTTGAVTQAAPGWQQTHIAVALEAVASDVDRRAEALKSRSRDQVGRVARNRFVAHNEHVLAGTRIPTRAVLDLHDAGYSNARIVREYPSLATKDVLAALAFERRRRAS